MTIGLNRAIQLFNLHKYTLAIKEIDKFLAEQPEHARAHSIKALALMKQKNTLDALDNATKAVSLGPEDDNSYYTLCLIYMNLVGDYQKAEAALQQALRINPEDPDYYDVMAQLTMVKEQYDEALQIVERGLKINPEHEDCLSTRARILNRIGKKNEASSTIRRALKRDPENPQTMASKGYICLESGDYIGAQEAFKNALKLNPEFEYARDGMAQALKARHFLFRQFIQFSVWYSKIGAGWRTGLFMGIFLLAQLARSFRFLAPLVFLYGLFAFSTWFIDPTFNLFLALDKYGKYALSKNDKIGASIMLVFILLAVASVICALILGQNWLYFSAVACFLFSIPVTRTAMYYQRKPLFKKMVIYTSIISFFLVLGLLAGPFDSLTGMVLLGLVIGGEVMFMAVVASRVK